jgi:hypothetical protein
MFLLQCTWYCISNILNVYGIMSSRNIHVVQFRPKYSRVYTFYQISSSATELLRIDGLAWSHCCTRNAMQLIRSVIEEAVLQGIPDSIKGWRAWVQQRHELSLFDIANKEVNVTHSIHVDTAETKEDSHECVHHTYLIAPLRERKKEFQEISNNNENSVSTRAHYLK